jgi:hypothetical protein
MSSAVEGREATVAALAAFLIAFFNTAYGVASARQTRMLAAKIITVLCLPTEMVLPASSAG